MLYSVSECGLHSLFQLDKLPFESEAIMLIKRFCVKFKDTATAS